MSGEYTCRAENAVGSASSTAELRVEKKAPLEKKASPSIPPKFITKLKNSSCLAGHTFVAEVQIAGSPLPDVAWSKEGVVLSQSKNVQIKQQGNKFSLVILRTKVRNQLARTTLK